jgi:hypothetical protein
MYIFFHRVYSQRLFYYCHKVHDFSSLPLINDLSVTHLRMVMIIVIYFNTSHFVTWQKVANVWIYGMLDRKQVLTILCKQTKIIYKRLKCSTTSKKMLKYNKTVNFFSSFGIGAHTIDTLQHQSLSLMSSALDNSTTSAP